MGICMCMKFGCRMSGEDFARSKMTIKASAFIVNDISPGPGFQIKKTYDESAICEFVVRLSFFMQPGGLGEARPPAFGNQRSRISYAVSSSIMASMMSANMGSNCVPLPFSSSERTVSCGRMSR